MQLIGWFLSLTAWLYLDVLTLRAILSLIPLFVRGWQPKGFLLVVAEITYTLTDPPLRFVRRFVPPARVGGTTWDLGFLVLYLVVWMAGNLVAIVFR